MDADQKQVFVVLNPVAGNAKEETILQALEERFASRGWRYNLYKTSGEENVAEVARAACQEGAELVIAAGGDGTVAGVVNGLVHSGIPLGILPVGTGNGLARALSIPLDLPAALDVITGEHDCLTIDAMQVGEEYYVLNVSVGISSRSMEKTGHEQKRRFGMAAYVWTFLNEVIGFRPRRFNLEVDGHNLQVRAAEILVANGAILQEPPYLFGAADSFTDAQVEAHLLLARSFFDYLHLAWQLLRAPQGRKDDLKKLSVRQSISIDAQRLPQPVQADGELIGETPVQVRVAPKALRVIVPRKEAAGA